MRHSRIFLRAEGSHFHVVSRIVDRRFLLGDAEKTQFHKLMRRLEKVAGVQVLTYCLMDNHVHLLLRTKEINGNEISDVELVRRVRGMYSKALARELEWQLETWRKKRNKNTHQFWREKYLSRLGNLSEFMRALKSTFSKWYNRKNERTGTLWEDRYKVVLVEGSEAVLMKIAAYIDLNPVRAGMISDPARYRWSGYGESCGGGVTARRGLTRVTGSSPRQGWKEAGPSYRMMLYYEGLEHTAGARVEVVRDRYGNEIKKRGALATADAEKVRKKKGGVGIAELLRNRVRYFTDGAVIGSRAFVDRIFKAQPAAVRRKRKTGARRMRGGDWGEEGLYALRDLKKNVLEKPRG